jgi:ATP adenylyltransferase
MDQLWAPWRLAYVATNKPTMSKDSCFICRGLAQQDDRKNLIVLRRPYSVVVLNRFPYNNGHLLVAPLLHKGSLQELTSDELLANMEMVREMVGVLGELMHPDGYNIGLNLGTAAGAGLPGHLHWHLVPRWNGDTNFMPIFADAKVLSQSLESLFDMITSQVKS